MPTPILSDFNALINSHIEGHAQLSHQLMHLCHVVNFTANTDLVQPNAAELNAQFIVIEGLIKEAQDFNQRLQLGLIQYGSTIKEEAE